LHETRNQAMCWTMCLLNGIYTGPNGHESLQCEPCYVVGFAVVPSERRDFRYGAFKECSVRTYPWTDVVLNKIPKSRL
jgi:hypothetical protein